MMQSSSPEPPLLATVFVLRYEKAFRSDKYMGRAAQKLGLSLIGQIDQRLSEELHSPNGRQPLTMTALRSDVAAALQTLVAQPADRTVDGWTVVTALASQHDWAGASTPSMLIRDHWKPASQLHLDFASPTSFKSIGLYRPLPEPALVFNSLLLRWRDLIGLPLPYSPESASFDTFLHDLVTIQEYELQSGFIPMKQGGIPAFVGHITYRIERQNQDLERRDPTLYRQLMANHASFASLINLLAHFSFFSGAGIKTAQGMGMMRPLPIP